MPTHMMNEVRSSLSLAYVASIMPPGVPDERTYRPWLNEAYQVMLIARWHEGFLAHGAWLLLPCWTCLQDRIALVAGRRHSTSEHRQGTHALQGQA